MRARLPVATTTSCAPSDATSRTSVFRRTSTDSSFICRSYQRISSRSFSLNDGAAAAMNTPPSLSLFSHSTTLWPRFTASMAA